MKLHERILDEHGKWVNREQVEDQSNTALINALDSRVARLENLVAQQQKAINILLLEVKSMQEEEIDHMEEELLEEPEYDKDDYAPEEPADGGEEV